MIRSCSLAAAATAALVATSCSSSSGDKASSSSGGVGAAMATVSGAGAASTYFEYGNMKRLRELGVVNATAQGGTDHVVDTVWEHVVGYGASAVAASARLLPGVIGLNLFASDRAVTIGTPPNTALRIDGVDTDAITARLTKLGAKPRDFDGTSGLSFGRDNAIADNRIRQTLFLPNQLDQIIATDGSFAASPNAATLEKVRGHEASLLDTGRYHDIADCLGDVIAAAVSASKPRDRSTVRAVGVRDPGSLHGQVSEVVCFVPASGQHDAVLAAAKAHLSRSAYDPVSRQPLSQYATDVAVDAPGALVRAVLTTPSGSPTALHPRRVHTQRRPLLGRQLHRPGTGRPGLLMPEGDTVWLTAHRLDAALGRRELTVADLRVPALATTDLRGDTVTEVLARGKHLLTRLDSGLTLHSHLRMDGSWYLTRAGERPRRHPEHMIRAQLGNADWLATGYRVHDLRAGRAPSASPNWSATSAPTCSARTGTPTSAVADLRASPTSRSARRCSTSATSPASATSTSARPCSWSASNPGPTGDVADLPGWSPPRSGCCGPTATTRSSPPPAAPDRGEEHWVYGAPAEPCLRCRTPIRHAEQGTPPYARSTYWCPRCQLAALSEVRRSARRARRTGTSRSRRVAGGSRRAASPGRRRSRPARPG